MVALVLAEQRSLSSFEARVLDKLTNYTKPIKTKHLATRLNVDRCKVVEALNGLRRGGLIHYTSPRTNKENDFYGWILVC